MVEEVSFGSESWSADFLSHLEAKGVGAANRLADGTEVVPVGYRLPVGSADQLDPLPWNGIDQVRIRFSEDVEVDASDLSLSGVNQPAYAFSDFDYYPEVRLAVWTLDSPLTAERYLLDLDADGLDPVVALDGEVLDGEWIDTVSTVSGDGVAGGDFEFEFWSLPGDYLGVDELNYFNYLHVYTRMGQSINDPNYHARADIDGDGLIEYSDAQVLSQNTYATTPVGVPAGASNDAPTTAGFATAAIDNEAIDVAFSLFDAFDDAEDIDADLSFAVTEVSHPALFDAVQINATDGTLTLNTAPAVSGRASITVQATDQSGAQVETTMMVRVAQLNSIPTLTVTPTDAGSNVWKIEGWVTDTDNTPEELDGMLVYLTGLIDARVSVAETGYYYYVAILDPGEGGSMWAETDDGESGSIAVYFEIGW